MGSIEEVDRVGPALTAMNVSMTLQAQKKTAASQIHEDDNHTEQESFSNAQEYSDLTLGYDFEDQQTRSQLELMDDLQRLGVSKYLDLPQLVVMGEQNVGKSSVLQAVTEIPFPIDEGMCTRFATEIVLRRTKPGTSTTIHVCIIPDVDESLDRKQILKEWSPEGLDCAARLDKEMMKDIFDQAQEIIFERPTSSPGRRNHGAPKVVNRLSSSTLQITRSGPRETNFAIVDIPGLVREQSRGNSEHRTARTLVEKYLNNVRSIIVVVIDVIDLERHAIFDMLSDLPGKESRVIGVINKCDTKQKQAADWVFDLIRNADPKSSLQYLKEGWYGLRNRATSELLVSDEERDRLEKEFFEGDEWKSLDDQRLGRLHLKNALIKMRNNHIKRSIPELLMEIDRELNTCMGRIEQLGEPRNTPAAQFATINNIATEYTRIASGAVIGHYKGLRSQEMYARKRIRDDLDSFQTAMQKSGVQRPFRTGDEDADLLDNVAHEEWSAVLLSVQTYAWIREAINDHRALEDSGEVNPEVKSHLWEKQVTNWKKLGDASLTMIEETVEDVNKALFAEACSDKDQLRKLNAWLEDDFRAAINAARFELKRIVMDETESFMTYNPLKARKQSARRIQRTEAIKKRHIAKTPNMALMQAAGPALNGVPLIDADLAINSLLHRDPELIGILNTHDSIAAYYDIALHRFIDNFALQVVERHLLGPNGPLRLFSSRYIARRLLGHDHELNELAGEEPEVAKERDALGKKRASLEEARKRAQGFKML